MAAAKRSKVKLKDSDFDYTQSKAKFFQYVKNTPHKLLTRQQYTVALRFHVRASKTTLNSELHQAEIYWDSADDEVSGKKPVLIMNRRIHMSFSDSSPGPVVRYLPVEDTFDVLIKFHRLTHHGGLTQMINFASEKNYRTNVIYLEFILMSCNVCADSDVHNYEPETDVNKQIVVGRSGRRGFNRVVILDVVNIRSLPGGNFKFLLIYVDSDTFYTLLRPLLIKCPFEVATELLKIISSFGLPNEFSVPAKSRKFFTEAVELLSSLGLQSEDTIQVKSGLNGQSREIEQMFSQWMKRTGHQNWGLACHIYQWELNNEAPNLLALECFRGESGSSYSTVFNDSLCELPEQYKQYKQDPFLLDSDVNEADEIETIFMQTDAMTIRSRYETTEEEFTKLLDTNTTEAGSHTDIKLEQDIIDFSHSNADSFIHQMPEIIIKEETLNENNEENESPKSYDPSEYEEEYEASTELTPDITIKEELMIETMENVEDESNDEILG